VPAEQQAMQELAFVGQPSPVVEPKRLPDLRMELVQVVILVLVPEQAAAKSAESKPMVPCERRAGPRLPIWWFHALRHRKR